MPYHVKDLSDDSLQTLWDVMEDLCKKSQLKQSSGFLEVTQYGTEKVSPDDYKMVIWGLQKDGHIKSEWGSLFLKDSFVEFFNAVGHEMHDRIHQRMDKTPTIQEKKKVHPQDRLRFDESGGELIVNGEHIKVISNKNFQEKLPHKLMAYILVKHKDEFFRKFSYIEFLNYPLFMDFKIRFPKIFWRKCHDSFENLNKKIQSKTGFDDFFKSESKANGKVFVNPNHLKALGLTKPELG